MTNGKFALTNELFKFSCKAAEIIPTKRQASKWRMGKGIAFQYQVQGAELLREAKNPKRFT